MSAFLDRLREPTTYLGTGFLTVSIEQIINGQYQTGVPLLITGILGMFMSEKAS